MVRDPSGPGKALSRAGFPELAGPISDDSVVCQKWWAHQDLNLGPADYEFLGR